MLSVGELSHCPQVLYFLANSFEFKSPSLILSCSSQDLESRKHMWDKNTSEISEASWEKQKVEKV